MSQAAASVSDRDLASIQEARSLARAARAAQATLAELSQEKVDAIIDAMAAAILPQAESLAALAVEETGYGNVPDKTTKNRFAAEHVYRFIRPLKTVGVVARHEDRRIVEIAEPFGVVAAIIPSTNPTSTAIYKTLISIKARCAIVLSPHPAAVRCITRSAEILSQAGLAAGLPPDSLSWMKAVTLEGTQELMRQREVAVILATGGMGLVRAAYSAGKPAYGVGPGNAPAYIERTADVRQAVHDVIRGKTFDHGVLCSSENSVVVDRAIADQARHEFVAQGAYFVNPAEAEVLARLLVTPQRLPNPALVGKSARVIAERAGFTVPPETRVLVAPLDGVGRDHPLSIEKLCPVLSYYVVEDWRQGCERCKQILRYGGMGHTMAIHSRDEEVILQFGLHKPAFRIVVNTSTSLGSIGLTTGLDPALTLGCGGFGGNITSDNITPRHLLNIKRLAYGVSEAGRAAAPAGPGPLNQGAGLRSKVESFLQGRGFGTDGSASPSAASSTAAPVQASPVVVAPAGTSGPGSSQLGQALWIEDLDFVAEEDVRRAISRGVRIRLTERAIVTPAARDLAATHAVFVADDQGPQRR